jgi:hypothetical protein
MAGLLDSIKNTVSDAADAVTGAVKDAGMAAACKVAELRVKELSGDDLSVDTDGDIPDEWKGWMMKTAINSICNDDTWDFLDKDPYNQRKVELWKERGIKNLRLRVKKDPEDDMHWVVCYPEWEEGSDTLYLDFYPRALNWSSNALWGESGSKCWWILRDEIVFGLRLYQLPGKCFYKSDMLENFEDVDEESPLPFGTKKYARWFQFRHWIMYWYPKAQWGWNYQWTTTPPKNADGSDVSLDNVLSLPSMPSLSMPSIKLPSLPDVSMPDVSMPDVSMPDAPSLSAPSLSAPSLGEMPSIPDKPKRPEGRWSCHGYVELEGMKVKADGKDIIFSNMKVTHFWENQANETKERQRWVLGCTSDEQAESWKETLMASGAEEGDAGGCCLIA